MSRPGSDPSDMAAVARLEYQDTIDRLEVLEADAKKDRRKAIAMWVCVGCSLALTLVSAPFIFVAGYPAWALWELRQRGSRRRTRIEELGKADASRR